MSKNKAVVFERANTMIYHNKVYRERVDKKLDAIK